MRHHHSANRLSRIVLGTCGSLILGICLGHAVHGQKALDSYFSSDIPAGSPSPWTKVPEPSKGADFAFTVFGDRTGLAYPHGMERAVAKINGGVKTNTVEPQFILSGGDNIEGYTRDKSELANMWDQFDGLVAKSRVAFIRVPGNHDLSNEVMGEVYTARYGRPYYYFIYENVLFLGLDTENPPTSLSPEEEVKLHALLMKGVEDGAKHPDIPFVEFGPDGNKINLCDPETTHNGRSSVVSSGDKNNPNLVLYPTNISDEQEAYFEKVLDEHPNVRWTFLYMHRPAWKAPQSANFAKLEQHLASRKYTVLAGHYHEYQHVSISGNDYFSLGPTAALPRCGGQTFANQVLNVRLVDGVPSYDVQYIDEHAGTNK